MEKPRTGIRGSSCRYFYPEDTGSIPQTKPSTTGFKHSSSLTASHKTPTEQQGIADFLTSIFDGRLSFSIMEADKSTWSIKYQQGECWNTYKKRFPERTKRRVSNSDWLKHANGKHVVIPRAGKGSSRWFALDIDQLKILETDLAFELIQIEQNTGLKLYYSRSTSGRAWHVWGFCKKATPIKELKTIGRWIEKHLSFKVDKVYPCGGLGITAPFRKDVPLFDIQGSEQTPDSIQFNNVSEIVGKLPSVELSTEAQNTIQAKSQPPKINQETKKTHVPEPMPDYPIPVPVGEALAHLRDKQTFINRLFELYPLHAEYRHWLCLLVSADLIKRFGCTLEETLQIIQQAAKSKNDEEIEDRLQTVKSTFKRFQTGQRIVSTRLYARAANFKTCFFTKTTSLKISRAELKEIVLSRAVTALYENGFFNGGPEDWQRISKRLLSSIAGIGENKALETLAELSKKGILKEVKAGKKKTSNYFVIGVNKNYSKIAPYLIGIESDPTALDLARTEKKNNKFVSERVKNDARKIRAKQSYLSDAPIPVEDFPIVEVGTTDSGTDSTDQLEPTNTSNTTETSPITSPTRTEQEQAFEAFMLTTFKEQPPTERQQKQQLHQERLDSGYYAKKWALEDTRAAPEKLLELETETEQRAAYAGFSVDDLAKHMARIREKKGVVMARAPDT